MKGKGERNMRKLVGCIILLFCFMLGENIVYASEKVIGKVLTTDIIAYIDELAIPCYDIDGKIGIIAEDLKNYGFDVIYSSKDNRLDITYKCIKQITANEIFHEKSPYFHYDEKSNILTYISNLENNFIGTNFRIEQNTNSAGLFVSNIYQTDISTRVNDKEVPSYNIGGKTIILIDSLDVYGNITWSSDKREIYFKYTPDWIINLVNDGYINEDRTISDFSIELNKNQYGGFDISSKNIEYLQEEINIGYFKTSGLVLGIYPNDFDLKSPCKVKYQFPSYADMTTDSSDGVYHRKNADFANKHIKVFINGKKLNICSVVKSIGNNHTDYHFYFDEKVKDFDEIQTLKLEYK